MARKKKWRIPKVTTVIGKETEIRGDVVFSGGLHVDGTVKGDVSGDQDDTSAITLSELGQIEGDVRVANVIVNGKVIGDVYALERVELAPKAKISGTVYYRFLEMSMGAEVNGQLVHAEGAIPQLEHDPSQNEEPTAMLGTDANDKANTES